MSHRSECKDPWEARREGERAFERGFGSNPYREPDTFLSGPESYEDRRCREEAASAWRRGRSAAEERAQEEQALNARRVQEQEEDFYEERLYEDEQPPQEGE